MMGIGEKAISKTVDETRGKFSRYIVATRPIAIGEKFTNENIGVKRTFPGCVGIEPRRIREILGTDSNMAYDTDDIIILNA
jgi:sialic acid synthase SpsE